MKESKSKPNISIRIDPDVLHQAKVEAVKSKKTLGAWLEEAIKEKVKKEKGGIAREESKVTEEKNRGITKKEDKIMDESAHQSLISLIKQRR